ncbi:TonB-dependent receptor [Mucilaginibacter daejeonensis]|uniref:TonB-dependent receptor domain-containing protein n=1 Tax=Mucilaginibacter daejeonensis TaxID=398049 RepID=UPI001D172A3E|nr:TonB-dependent receptor [Mucilaginibacter daejeonensis]UEG53040.1 TonB-dependent receptor [Mucilaginibacter daejeonensis]
MKPIIYKIFAAIALIAGPVLAKAQAVAPTGKVNGNVINDQNKPVDFATITLLRAKDSTVVKSSLTNEAGHYTIERIVNGTYLIKATVVGYEKMVSAPVSITANSNITVPALQLRSLTKNLSAVNVVATKPLIERKIDRTVMNVENSVLAAGNSAMEILERAPGVTVDKDDNISLKGKQGVTVMIDNKLTYLSAAQLATLLRSTDGNNIQSIEIITNPSAKYDAAGNAGIINIKMKKNRQAGTNGSFAATGGYGHNHKASTSLNLNHKENNVNIFGNYSYNNNKRPQDITLNRTISNGGTNTFFNERTDMLRERSAHNYKAGADWDINKRNTLGIQVSGYNSASDASTFNNTLISPDQITNSAVTTTRNMATDRYNNITANINNRMVFDTLGKELSMDADYSYFWNRQTNNYTNNYFFADGQTLRTQSLLRNSLPTKIDIVTYKADYVNPIGKTMKLEAGLKVSYVGTNNDLRTDSLLNNNWVADAGRTNLYKYTENVNAAYFNFSKSWKKTSVQAGLRAEQTNSKGDSRDIKGVASVNERHYLSWFPSVFVNQELSDNHTLGINYSRRIDRPSYDDLNSFVQILNAYTYQQGNPNLRPQFTNSYELSYTFKKRYNLTLGYSRTTDVMVEVPKQIDAQKVTFITRENLAIQNSYNLNMNLPFTIAKWWSMNNNITGFYLGFKANSPDLQINNGQYAANGNSINTFTVSKTLKFEGTFNYQSALTYGLFHIRRNYGFDAGVSRSFAAKKATLKFSVSDIFNTRQQYLTVRQGNLNFNVFQKNETRVARLTFTYNFGNAKIQSRRHNSASGAEQGRVKGGN